MIKNYIFKNIPGLCVYYAALLLYNTSYMHTHRFKKNYYLLKYLICSFVNSHYAMLIISNIAIQNSKLLKITERNNITLVFNNYIKIYFITYYIIYNLR